MSTRDDRPAPLPESAGSHATSKIPVLPADASVSDALARVLEGEWDAAEQVWVVDAERRPVGRIALEDLLRSAPAAVLAHVCDEAPPGVAEDLDQERVALHAITNRLHEVPVLDPQGRLRGVVLAGTLLRILRSEHVEDLHRLVGIQPVRSASYDALEDPPRRSAAHRLPWLLVGLAGSMIATWTMSSYEAELERRVALGFFVPGIVYLADAIGTQSEALAVRRLARTHPPFSRLFFHEMYTGIVVGAVLAVLTLAAVWAAFSDIRLALAVAAAVLLSGAIATSIGVALPWLLTRIGRDPAVGSGPLATIIQDCLSILVYFGVAIRLLS